MSVCCLRKWKGNGQNKKKRLNNMMYAHPHTPFIVQFYSMYTAILNWLIILWSLCLWLSVTESSWHSSSKHRFDWFANHLAGMRCSLCLLASLTSVTLIIVLPSYQSCIFPLQFTAVYNGSFRQHVCSGLLRPGLIFTKRDCFIKVNFSWPH